MNFKLWLEQGQVTQIRGEYWIEENGHVEYADGDVGDMNHEGIVIQRLIGEVMDMFGIYSDDEYFDWDEITRKIFEEIKKDSTEEERKKYDQFNLYSSDVDRLIISKMKEMGDQNPEEKIRAILGNIDPRSYAMKYWGWYAVRNNYIESWTLTPKDMKTIAEGLYEIEPEISEEAEFYIAAYGSHQEYRITLRELDAGRIGDLPEVQPTVASRKIDQWNNALTQNASAQGREAEIKKLDPYYQNRTFPLGDSFVYKKSRLWTEQSKIETVPISSLIATKEEISQAVDNISRGYGAQTMGPIKVVLRTDMKPPKYQVVNGYHRLVEAIARGETEIQIAIEDEDISGWMVPRSNELFQFNWDLPYRGLEDFIEPYQLRNL